MKAAFLEHLGEMKVKEVSSPHCGADEVVIKVVACAICGTDVRVFLHGHRNVKLPWIIGHEISGVIEEVGHVAQPRIAPLKKGDAVQVVPDTMCGKCDYCLRGEFCPYGKSLGYDLPGGFAQYLAIPWEALPNNLVPIPEGVSFEEAALAEPLACALNGQAKLQIGLGDTVVIIGAGSIGVMHAKLALWQGASKVILADVIENKLLLARDVLSDSVIYVNSSKEQIAEVVQEVTKGEGANQVIISCSSKAAQESSLKLAARKGKVLFFGGLPPDDSVISFDSNLLHYHEISVMGTYGSTIYQQRFALKRLIAAGFTKGIITHTFPISRIQEAFETAVEGKGLKIIIKPWE